MERSTDADDQDKKDAKARTPDGLWRPMPLPLGEAAKPRINEPPKPPLEAFLRQANPLEQPGLTENEEKAEEDDDDDDADTATTKPLAKETKEEPAETEAKPMFADAAEVASPVVTPVEQDLPEPPPPPQPPIFRQPLRSQPPHPPEHVRVEDAPTEPPEATEAPPPTRAEAPTPAETQPRPPEQPVEMWAREEAAARAAVAPEGPRMHYAANQLGPPSRLEYHRHPALEREIAGAFITSVLLGWYFAHRVNRKLEKHEKRNQRDFKAVKQANLQQTEAHQQLQNRFNRYTTEQQRSQEAADLQHERDRKQIKELKETEHQAMTPEQIKLLQQQAQEHAPETKLRFEQDAWKRYAVVNGKLEQDAIEYGRAFQEEQRAEKVGSQVSPPGYGAGQSSAMPAVDPAAVMLPSGQASTGYQLPASSPLPADPQHLLGTSYRSPIGNAVMNPWLWAGVGILLLAFFTAAFL